MNEPHVHIPFDHPDPPETHEVEAAWLLARHYCVQIDFLKPVDGYKTKTADLVIEGQVWELKCPSGKSKTTVGNQFKRAVKQSKYIIFDGRRIGIPDNEVKRRIEHELRKRKAIKRLLYIDAKGTVMEIHR